jgi:DNA-binding response OmpR family regulator
MSAKRILVVDEGSLIGQGIKALLEDAGYTVYIAWDPRQAAHLMDSWMPHAIVLDLDLAGGMDLLAELRASVRTPIVAVSAGTAEAFKVKAFDLGADDYVVKPVNTELIARLAAPFRRIPDSEGFFRLGDLAIDFSSHQVFKAGREVRLTSKEFQILACLAKEPGVIMAPGVLLAKVWGAQAVQYVQTLRVHIGRLRQKLESGPAASGYIRTVSGVGYGLIGPSSGEE